VELFLEGYQSGSGYSRESFNYYFTLIASWFYTVGNDEPGYQDQVRSLTMEFIEKS
jgi:hypothetical protein